MQQIKRRIFSMVLAVVMLVGMVPVTVMAADAFAISGHPADASVEIGGKAVFEVEVTADGSESYQWQYRTSSTGGWKTSGASGNKTAALKVTAKADFDGYEYRCKVTASDETVLYSDAAALNVYGVIAQPESQNVTEGGTAVFAVDAIGSGLTYQWQYQTTTSATWKNSGSTGNKTDTLSVGATAARDGYSFRCMITDDEEHVFYSDVVTLTVASGSAITMHPADVSVEIGGKATFEVAADGAESYQWQYRTSSTGEWKTSGASGNKTAALKVTAKAGFDGYEYRCEVTFADGTVDHSDAATLNVYGVTVQPENQNVTEGGTAVFEVTAKGSGLTYQWQYQTATSTIWKNSGSTGNKTDTLSVGATMGRNGYSFRCKITDDAGNVFYSDAVTLTVVSGNAITAHPADVSAEIGTKATFEVAANGAKSYQWQYRTSASASWTTSGATGNKTATLTAPVLAGRDGYQYRCKITFNDSSVDYSEAGTLSVYGVTAQPESQVVNEGGTAAFKVSAMGSGLTYQWQYQAASSTAWKNSGSSGNKTDALSVGATAARNGFKFRCQITDDEGNVFYSDAAALTVVIDGAIAVHPSDVSVKIGGKATFEVVAGGAESYQWQYRTSSTGSWKNSGASGNKTAALKVTAKADFDGYEYRCKVAFADGTTENSDAAVLSVYGVTVQPESQTVAKGKIAKFKVEAKGSGLVYQWQYQTASSTTWKNSVSDGNDTATLSISATAGRDGYKFRCKITDDMGHVFYSGTAVLTVFYISTQPQNVCAEEGDEVTFTVAAKGGQEPYTYLWQWNDGSEDGEYMDLTEEDSDWCSGYDTNALTITVAEDDFVNGYLYRCVVTDENGLETISAGVKPEPMPLTVENLEAPEVASGGKFTLTANATGGVEPYEYQWYYKYPGIDWRATDATQTLTRTVSGLMLSRGYSFYCEVTDYNGATAQSNAVDMKEPVRIKYQPESVATASGGTFNFEVTAVGGTAPYTYEWQWSDEADGAFVPFEDEAWASGTDTGVLTVTRSAGVLNSNNYRFRCVVADAKGKTVTSEEVILKLVDSEMIITTQPEDQTVAEYREAVVFTAEVEGGTKPYSYQWQFILNSNEDFKDITDSHSWASGWDDTELTVTTNRVMLNEGIKVRCIITDADGIKVTSDVAAITLE